MIPQDPVFFCGTIRTNIDPFGEHDDQAIMAALRCVDMVTTVEQVRSMPLPLPTNTLGSLSPPPIAQHATPHTR